MQYAQDYDERTQQHCNNSGEDTITGAADCWTGVLQPYIKSTQVLICPSGGGANPFYAWDLNGNNRRSLGSYATPAQKMLFSEHDAHGGGYLKYATCCAAPPGATDSHVAGHDPTAGTARHNEGNNVGFVDGHCKWMKVSNIVDWTAPCALWIP